MPHKSDRPQMDPRLDKRIKRKKDQLDSYRPLPNDTVRRLNDDLRVFLTYHSNAIEGNSLSLRLALQHLSTKRWLSWLELVATVLSI